MTTATLMRRDDVDLDPALIVAASFLARYPAKTRAGYRLALKQWFDFCEEHRIPPLGATRGDVDMFIRWRLEVVGNMASTVCGRINAISGFYRCAVIDHRIAENPAQYAARPYVSPESTTEGLTREEFHAVLDEAELVSPNELILVGFLGLLGMRISEACSRDLSSLKRSGGALVIWIDRGKHNRSGWAPVPRRLSRPLDDMLVHRGGEGPILRLPRKDKRMDRPAAALIVARLVKAAGIDKHITPHSFRHTYETMALDAGCTDRELVNSLGLRDSRSIHRYDRNKEDLTRHVGPDVEIHVSRARPVRVDPAA